MRRSCQSAVRAYRIDASTSDRATICWLNGRGDVAAVSHEIGGIGLVSQHREAVFHFGGYHCAAMSPIEEGITFIGLSLQGASLSVVVPAGSRNYTTTLNVHIGCDGLSIGQTADGSDTTVACFA